MMGANGGRSLALSLRLSANAITVPARGLSRHCCVPVKGPSFSADVTKAGVPQSERPQAKLGRAIQSKPPILKAIMNSRNPVLTSEKQHQDWLPFLEFATREVFQMMLASELTKPETAGPAAWISQSWISSRPKTLAR